MEFPDDADNIRYAASSKSIIVGYAGAKALRNREEGTGGLGFINSEGKKTGEIILPNGISFFGTPLLGAPVQIETGLFRCPAKILGLGVDQIVFDPAGDHAFVALCHTLDLIGQILEGESKSLNLQNRYKKDETRSPARVWQYMDQPREQT